MAKIIQIPIERRILDDLNLAETLIETDYDTAREIFLRAYKQSLVIENNPLVAERVSAVNKRMEDYLFGEKPAEERII